MNTLMISLLVACGSDADTKPTPKPEAKAVVKKEEPKPEPKKKAFADMEETEQHAYLMEAGKEVYLNAALACQTCHGAEGKGQTGVFPPLVGQKDHMGDCVKHAAIVIYGLNGEMVVDGVTYNGNMVAQGSMLDDMQIAAVISYERNSWGNDYGWCSPEDVKKARMDNPLAK